jgi:hypothetical protein
MIFVSVGDFEQHEVGFVYVLNELKELFNIKKKVTNNIPMRPKCKTRNNGCY